MSDFNLTVEELDQVNLSVEEIDSKVITLTIAEQGFQGPQGIQGEGVATGGTTGQLLNKKSNTDYDTEWKTISKSDVGLTNVLDLDQSNPENITQDATHRFASDTEKSTWNGKQDALGFTPVPTTRKINGYDLGSDINLSYSDVSADISGAASSVQGNLTSHINSTGASAHGLGTISTYDETALIVYPLIFG